MRTKGSWQLTVAAEDADRPRDLAEILSDLGLDTGSGPAPRSDSSPQSQPHSPPHATPPDDATVALTGTLVGRIEPGRGLSLETAAGDVLVLDADDLALVDQIDEEPVRLADLHGPNGAADAEARLARLVRAGCLASDWVPDLEDAPDAGADEPAPVAASAPSTRSNLSTRSARSTRSWLGGLVSRLSTRHEAAAEIQAEIEADEEAGDEAGADLQSPTADVEADDTSPDPSPAPALARPTVAASGGPDRGGPAGRVPVYAIWHPHVGPLLSLGMLTASARHHRDGLLNEVYEIRRPESAASFLADLADRPGPAVLLCSDYVWSVRENLVTAREALALNPELVVIHGGPSSPKYEADAEQFLDEHGEVAHILTRGEGEHMVCELLEALAPTLPGLDAEALARIDGITFRAPTGEVVRTPDRDRIADLDALPSPYLTGEFDHIAGDEWNTCLAVETNRGCPYRCTFCDWGSSTMSRIRMFSLDRVTAEIRWAAHRGIEALNVPDANFGIMSRDVETATRIAAIKNEIGYPRLFVCYPAKNTTKHLIRIMDILGDAGLATGAALSLQTVDEHTLEVLDRSNISTDHFVALAADYRRRGHPLIGDLLLGLPGQTYDSFKRDIQFMFDQEILTRVWPVQVLPNSPMNAPAYRAEHAIEYDEEFLVTRTASFTPEDRARMIRLRRIDIICERFGLLRHVMRWLQWDNGIPGSEVMHHLLELTAADPNRYPHISWVLNHFDHHPTAPASWSAFYDEVRDLLHTDFAIAPSTALDTVLRLNQFLMPVPGRTFPATITLEHDYTTYWRTATDDLYTTGHAGVPAKPLHEHGPASFTVTGDPFGLCTSGLKLPGDSRSERMQGEFQIGSWASYELVSPLIRILPGVAARGLTAPAREVSPEVASLHAVEFAGRVAEEDLQSNLVPVMLSSRDRSAR